MGQTKLLASISLPNLVITDEPSVVMQIMPLERQRPYSPFHFYVSKSQNIISKLVFKTGVLYQNLYLNTEKK